MSNLFAPLTFRKSRIAIEYCYNYKQEHPKANVFWIHCGNRARFEAAYHEVANALKVPGYGDLQRNPLQLLSDWLSDRKSGPWLMILDNADDAEVWIRPTGEEPVLPPLATFIPRGFHGSVLITTRDSQVGKQLTNVKCKPIDVLALRPKDAEALLWSKLSEEELSPEDAKEITRALDYLPLAITQAAAFLDQNDITVAHYLQLYGDGKAQMDDLLEPEEHDTGRYYEIQNSVYHTWKISFEQIVRQALLASDTLSLMAMFDRQSIPMALLRTKVKTEIELLIAIGKLKAFSLIAEEAGGRSFSIHHIVQLSIQRWLTYRSKLVRWQEIALTTVHRNCPRHDSFLHQIMESLNPHIQAVLGYQFDTVDSSLKIAEIRQP